MKNTLRFFLSFTLLLSGILSFADKSNDTYVCPTASINYASAKFCISDINVQAVNLTGTDAYLGGTFSSTSGLNLNPTTGSIIPSSSIPGTYMVFYTIPSGPGCPSTMVTTTVEIVAQADAGMDGNMTVCETFYTVIDLHTLISGEQTGGIWTQTSGTGGTFNAVAGTFTPAAGATTSTFTYTLFGPAPCVDDISVATINISPAPTNITISGSTTICAGSSANLTIIGTPGVVITMATNGGASFTYTIGASGSIVISVSPTATTTYSLLSANLNGCNIPLMQNATVTVSPTPQFITQIPDIVICNGSMLNIASQLTSTIPGATFIWSAVTSNVNTAFISGDHTNIDLFVNLINTSQTGIINIEIKPQIGNCYGASQQILVTVKPIPTITSTTVDEPVICNNQFVTIATNSNPTATIYNWEINTANGIQIVGGATNGTSTTGIVNLQLALIDPLMTGSISFNITPANGICTGAAIISDIITVNPIPGSPIGLPIDEICSGETSNFTISSFPNFTGTILEWTVTDSQNVNGFSNGYGLSPFTISDILINTSDIQGFVKYSVTSKLGNCQGGTTEYTVLVNPLPKPDLLDGHICVNQTTLSYILDTQLTNPNFTYDWYVLNTTTNVYDALVSTNQSTYEVTLPGTYQVVVTNIVTNCQQTNQATVVIINPATAFTTIVTNDLNNNSTITVTVNPTGSGNLIYALDGGVWQNSNVFTGVEPGTHTVSVSDLEGCTNLSIEIIIENEEGSDLVMYPNPSFDTINFSYNNKVKSVQISNQIGQTVLTKEVNLKNGSLDISVLNMGIYNIEFETEAGIVSRRIIKQ